MAPAGVNGAEGAEPALAQGAFAFQLRLGLHREAGPGNGFEPGFRNGFAGQFAHAVGVALDAAQRFLDLVDGVLIGGEQAQGEIAVEIVRAGIGHVEAVAGHFLGGFLGQPLIWLMSRSRNSSSVC